MIHRFGNPVILPIPALAGSTQAIKADAAIWLDTTNNVAKPASAFTWDTSEDITTAKFAGYFVGIGRDNIVAGMPADVLNVMHCGVHEFPIASGAYKKGTLLRMKKNASSNLVDDFIVTPTTRWRSAIAQVIKDHPAGSTTVLAAIMSRYALGLGGYNPLAHIHEVSFAVVDTTGTVVNGYVFDRRVALLNAQFISNVIQASADKVFTFKKGSTTLSPTLTTPVSGAAVGKVVSADFDPSVADNQFGPTDTLVIADDGGGTGNGTMVVRFIDLPGATG